MTSTTAAALDISALTRHLDDVGVERKGALRADLISGGRSNLTFLIYDDRSTWVLRRPPIHGVTPSAHDMTREFRVVSALAATDIPVARPVVMCNDDTVLGAPFTLVDYVMGQVVRTETDLALLGDDQAVVDCVNALIDVLADLHAVDPGGIGLADWGRPQGYLQRQVKRWGGQWEQSKTRECPDLDDLTRRLIAAQPDHTETTLVHGDFHLRNVITSASNGEVVAALDWELCTLGDPLADVGSLLAYWPAAGENTGGDFPASALPGFPSREEISRIYLEATGRDPAALKFWHTLGLWKIAVIAEGVMRRARDEPQNAAESGTPTVERIDALVAKAREIADQAGI